MIETNRPVAASLASASAEARFISKVYGWMSVGLVVTALTAMFTLNNPALLAMILENKFAFYGLLLGELGLVIYLTSAIGKIGAQTASFLFLLYSMLNGLTLSIVFLIYTYSSIGSTFAITAATFGVMSAYGYFTKKDLTSIGNICIMGLIGVIIASVVNIFMQSQSFDYAISYIAILVFVGLIAYDTQRIKAIYRTGAEEGSGEYHKASILGALILYLDFINLFLNLLRILGKRK